jgi:hypothetical protein
VIEQAVVLKDATRHVLASPLDVGPHGAAPVHGADASRHQSGGVRRTSPEESCALTDSPEQVRQVILARLGPGGIGLKARRRIAPVCQQRPLYRFVADAEIDIGVDSVSVLNKTARCPSARGRHAVLPAALVDDATSPRTSTCR